MIASKIKSEKSATKFLEKYYLEDPAEINLLGILGYENIFYQEREIESSLGSLIRHKKRGQILINSRVKDTNQKRFIIAHELGHWVLHENMPVFNCDHSKFKYWSKEISLIEKEANWFASEFLMPQPSFIKFCEGKSLSINLVSDISKRYKVSLTATAIRLANCGSKSIMVIYSKNNRMSWSSYSNNFRFSFYGKNLPVPNKSLTFKLLEDFKYKKREDVVLAKEWFPNDHSVQKDSYLQEIVFPMPNYQSCLTILWEYELNL